MQLIAAWRSSSSRCAIVHKSRRQRENRGHEAMPQRISRHALLLSVLLGLPFTATAQAQQTSTDQPVYKLPMRGAPASRIGGGTRGPNVDSPAVTVFAPDHTGLTTNPQPALYWSLSKQAPVQIELTLLDEAGVKPLIEKTVSAPMQAGIHALSLKDAGVTLAPDVDYRWHVALVFDPKMRSSDVTSSGTIRLVPAPAALASKLAAGERAAPAVYASEGLWYDSIEALMRLIDASPQDKQLRDQLDSLLTQVGLTHLAGQR
jgi:hypothetical protein